jgi:molybdate/tungstate transport system permease protein
MNRFSIGLAIIAAIPILLIILGIVSLIHVQLIDVDLFVHTIVSKTVIDSLFLTFSAALCATLLLILTSTPLAYLLARHTFPFKSTIEDLINIPMVVPHTVAGIMVYLLFMRKGMIGSVLLPLGIIFEEAFWGIVVAMFFVGIPLYTHAVRDGISQMPLIYDDSAKVLGASPAQRFMYITIPYAHRHIMTGSILAWSRGVSEFAAVVMIAYHPMIISTLIYHEWSIGGLSAASAVALVMICVSLVMFVTVRIIGKREKFRYI